MGSSPCARAFRERLNPLATTGCRFVLRLTGTPGLEPTKSAGSAHPARNARCRVLPPVPRWNAPPGFRPAVGACPVPVTSHAGTTSPSAPPPGSGLAAVTCRSRGQSRHASGNRAQERLEQPDPGECIRRAGSQFLGPVGNARGPVAHRRGSSHCPPPASGPWSSNA